MPSTCPLRVTSPARLRRAEPTHIPQLIGRSTVCVWHPTFQGPPTFQARLHRAEPTHIPHCIRVLLTWRFFCFFVVVSWKFSEASTFQARSRRAEPTHIPQLIGRSTVCMAPSFPRTTNLSGQAASGGTNSHSPLYSRSIDLAFFLFFSGWSPKFSGPSTFQARPRRAEPTHTPHQIGRSIQLTWSF